MATERPVTLLIAALGGEGGGVLTDWIVQAAGRAGLPVQSTSIPGVAQRTGATTYYIEIFPVPRTALGGRRPVLSLFPSAGDVDLMVASEIVEAGRAIQHGYVTPDRTTLIASTHRVYAIAERMAMADGRFDSVKLLEAARARSRRCYLADLSEIARDTGSVLNAVLLGVIAGVKALPVPPESFEAAIREEGKAVESNLRGFQAGLALVAAHETGMAALPQDPAKRRRAPSGAEIEARVARDFPEATREVLTEGVRRLVGYQDAAYAARYLDRLARVRDAEQAAGGDFSLARETGSQLALWMSYEDVIRVAQLKIAPDRYGRILGDVRAKEHEPVRVTEFFKPGIDEFCSILPAGLARRVVDFTERRGWRDRLYVGMHIKSTTITGFLRMWALARLKPWRPRSWRFGEEQRAIDGWLDHVVAAAGRDLAVAREIAECARLIKGYGETHRRGSGNFRRIMEAVVAPALAAGTPASRTADAIANARAAALADPSGARLESVLEALAKPELAHAAE